MYTAAILLEKLKKGGGIYAKKDGIKVYATTEINSESVLFATDTKNTYRKWKKGDQIGYLVENWNGEFVSANGSLWLFLPVKYWRRRTFDWVRDIMPAYLRIEDDSFVIESDLNAVLDDVLKDEKAEFAKELELYTSGLTIAQRPADFFKEGEKWVLKFTSGATVDFEEYKKLSNAQRAAFGTDLKNNFNGNNNSGTGSGTKTSFFTTTNVIIGVGILAALGIVLFLIFRRNGRVTKRQ